MGKPNYSQSRMNYYLALKSEYELAEYRISVRGTRQRHVLAKYRLSDHNLAGETGKHQKTWLPKKERICGHCQTGKVETEEHFLLHCHKHKGIRELSFPGFKEYHPNFDTIFSIYVDDCR